MGIDYTNLRFTPECHEVLPAQAEQLLRNLEPGDIAYIDIDDHWVDYERKVWIDGNGSQYTLDEINEQSCAEEFARIICTHDGLVLDFSHFDRRDWSTNKILQLDPKERYDQDAAYYPMPVIYLVTNKDELEVVQRILHTYNIDLTGSELDDVEYEAILSGEDMDDSDDADEQ